MKIELPLKKGKVHLVPSLNIMLNEHFRAKMLRKNILHIILGALDLKPVKGAYHIKYTRFCVRTLDPIDNLGASIKNLIDVLIEKKILEDDSLEFVKSIEANQFKVKTKKEERFLLEITQ